MHSSSAGLLRWLRAAYVTLAVFTVSIGAHALAGGELPTLPLLLVFALACCALCAVFAGRRFTTLTLVILMAGLEFLLHFALSALSSATHAAHSATSASATHVHDQSLTMLLAHAGATFVLAMLIASSDRTIWLIWSWIRRGIVLWTTTPVTGTLNQALALSNGEHAFVPTPRVASKSCTRRGPPRS